MALNETNASDDGRQGVAFVRMELMAGEEADAVAAAVLQQTPDAIVEQVHGIVQISAPGHLEFNCEEVSDHLGRKWDTRHLQVIMANYAGFITRMDEEGVQLRWGKGQT